MLDERKPGETRIECGEMESGFVTMRSDTFTDIGFKWLTTMTVDCEERDSVDVTESLDLLGPFNIIEDSLQADNKEEAYSQFISYISGIGDYVEGAEEYGQDDSSYLSEHNDERGFAVSEVNFTEDLTLFIHYRPDDRIFTVSLNEDRAECQNETLDECVKGMVEKQEVMQAVMVDYQRNFDKACEVLEIDQDTIEFGGTEDEWER